MSILVVQLAPAGLLFGADRNITDTLKLSNGRTEIVVRGQSERPKVLKWPNKDVIVGYVGQAELDKRATDEWLYGFIGDHLQFSSLQELADALTADLNLLLPHLPQEHLIMHLGGFEHVHGQGTPRVYFIRNTTTLTPEGQYVLGTKFDCSEELSSAVYFGPASGNAIRIAVAWPNYFSFRQGYRLNLFNTIDEALRVAMNTLISAGLREVPISLDQLGEHVKFQIHGYSAYFASFYPAFEQYVGGGADVVTAAWP